MNISRRSLVRLLLALGLPLGSTAIGQRERATAQSTVPGRILFVHDAGIAVWSNGNASDILQIASASDARWSPDGSQVLYVVSGNSYSDLVIYNSNTKSNVQITNNKPPYEEGTPEYAAASAWALDPEWSTSGLIGFMSDAGSPDATFQLWLMDDPSRGAYLAPAAQFEDNVDSLSLSGDGSLAAYSVQARQPDGTSINRAILRDLTDGVAYPLSDSLNAFDPAISPDQQSVAVAVRADSGMSDIFSINRSSGDAVQLTQGLQATNPTWSPDGQWLAFIRMVDFEFEVWAVPMNAGVPGEPAKLFGARGLDARSGLSWTHSG